MPGGIPVAPEDPTPPDVPVEPLDAGDEGIADEEPEAVSGPLGTTNMPDEAAAPVLPEVPTPVSVPGLPPYIPAAPGEPIDPVEAPLDEPLDEDELMPEAELEAESCLLGPPAHAAKAITLAKIKI